MESDSNDESLKEEPQPQQKVSKLSPERLEKLAAARAKAMEKKKLLKDLRENEKKQKQDELNMRIKKVEEFEKKQKQELIKKPKKKLPQLLDDPSDESSEEEEEEEVVIKPKSSKPRNITQSTHELTGAIAREELLRRVREENYKSAFQSLFPMHNMTTMMS
jgi:hypothetical protein